MEDYTYYRTVARIDLGAIRENFLVLKSRLASGEGAMAVVKADAYGHGAVRVGQMLTGLADYLAVADIYEAVELRLAGIDTPILILSYTHPSYFTKLLNYGITATVYSLADAIQLSGTALLLGTVARVHIAVDTGMGRIGLPCDELGMRIATEICKLRGLSVEGIFSHLATADDENKHTAYRQCDLFDSFCDGVLKQGIVIPISHMSSSAAALSLDRRYSMCRFGIAMYGIDPLPKGNIPITLHPAMEVTSRVIHIKWVEPGVGIGYGHTYVTPSKRKIATLSIGYADGFKRSLGNRGHVLINGSCAPVVGRVCMDQIMVDVTDTPDVQVGDIAVILGSSGELHISACDLATLADTIPYEILCGFSTRVKRVYV